MMGRFGYGHHGDCGCCHDDASWYGRGPAWAWQPAMTRDDVVQDMEDYKAQLEAEITALEKRISSLKEKK